MTKKKNKNVMLTLTLIFTILQICINVFVGFVLAFNLWGFIDYYNELMSSVIANYDLNMYLTSYYIELALASIINIYSAIFYFKGIKYRVSNKQYGKMVVVYAIIQLLFSAYIPAIFGIITGALMINKKPTIAKSQEQSFLSDYKLMAMSEAVTRLKELRATGAISEEEYYANLNKILEG